jgi:hypothetical protein
MSPRPGRCSHSTDRAKLNRPGPAPSTAPADRRKSGIARLMADLTSPLNPRQFNVPRWIADGLDPSQPKKLRMLTLPVPARGAKADVLVASWRP